MDSKTYIAKCVKWRDGVWHARQNLNVCGDGFGNVYSYGRHYPLLVRAVAEDGTEFYLRNVRGYSVSTAKHISWSFSACWAWPKYDLPFPHQLRLDLSNPKAVLAWAQAFAEAEVARLQAELPKLRANAFRKRAWMKHELDERLNLLEFILDHSKPCMK